jgi:hypothetical protein
MKRNYKYQFDKDSGILYKFYYGVITLEDIYTSWDYAIANDQIPSETKGFILDYRKASLDIEIFEYSKIADYYRMHIEIFKDKKIAIVTESVQDIVIPILVETKDQGYKSRPFSKLEPAIKWVLDNK